MTPESLVQALAAMSDDDLRRTAELAARFFAQKAEQVYEQDPENNGRKAQEYADVSTCLEEAALIGVEPEGPSPIEDDELLNEPSAPTTVSQAVAVRATKNPWAGR